MKIICENGRLFEVERAVILISKVMAEAAETKDFLVLPREYRDDCIGHVMRYMEHIFRGGEEDFDLTVMDDDLLYRMHKAAAYLMIQSLQDTCILNMVKRFCNGSDFPEDAFEFVSIENMKNMKSARGQKSEAVRLESEAVLLRSEAILLRSEAIYYQYIALVNKKAERERYLRTRCN
jgi:hypothetical protein